MLLRSLALLVAASLISPDYRCLAALGAARCDCITPGPPRVAQAEAVALFLVQVEEVGPARIPFHGGRDTYDGRLVRGRVLAAWPTGTSVSPDTIASPLGRPRLARPAAPPLADSLVTFGTGVGGGDCGFSFRAGQTYLVYATGRREALHTSICSRTRPLEEATEDLEALGMPMADRRSSRSGLPEAVTPN